MAFTAMMLGMVGLNALPTQKASAGWTETNPVTSEALTKDLSLENGWRSQDGILLEDQKIVFSKDTLDDARLLYAKTELNAGIEKSYYVIKATIKVDEMLGDKRFGIGFGCEYTKDPIGKPNTNYLYVKKNADGKFVPGFSSVDASGEAFEIAQNTDVLNGSEWAFEIKAEYTIQAPHQKVTAKIGDKTIYEGYVKSEELNGYFGFFETGLAIPDEEYVVAYVSDLTVDNNYYLAQENVNINDDFNDGSVDATAWHVYDDKGINLTGIAETDGMLRFFDAYEETISTKYKYANFEMSFDIPYVKKTVEYNSDGTVRSNTSSEFGIFCGLAEVSEYDNIKKASAVQKSYSSAFALTFQNEDLDNNKIMDTTITFAENSIYANEEKRKEQTETLDKKYDLWDEKNEERVLNVVFTCVDGTYTCDIKWADETDYVTVFTKTVAEKRPGFISFFGMGSPSQKANVAFDNVKITNRDYKGNVISGKPSSNDAIKVEGDFGYADSKSPAQLVPDGTDFDGVQATVETKKGCSSVINIGGMSIATLAVGMAVLTKRRNKR